MLQNTKETHNELGHTYFPQMSFPFHFLPLAYSRQVSAPFHSSTGHRREGRREGGREGRGGGREGGEGEESREGRRLHC